MRVGFGPDSQKKNKQNCTISSVHFQATGIVKLAENMSVTCAMSKGGPELCTHWFVPFC